jgi:hypothetical protein
MQCGERERAREREREKSRTRNRRYMGQNKGCLLFYTQYQLSYSFVPLIVHLSQVSGKQTAPTCWTYYEH